MVRLKTGFRVDLSHLGCVREFMFSGHDLWYASTDFVILVARCCGFRWCVLFSLPAASVVSELICNLDFSASLFSGRILSGFESTGLTRSSRSSYLY